jgi:hypothetical protein
MDIIIALFICVQRGLTTTHKATSLMEYLVCHGHEGLAPEDHLFVFDSPFADAVTSNVGSVTVLTRSVLVERAAESRELLTEAELDLLLGRYWLEVMERERIRK